MRESKSNGAMERAIRTWQGLLRTLKCAVERHTGGPLPILHTIVEWIALWACALFYKFRKNRYGKTPYQVVTWHQRSRPIAHFGEIEEFTMTDRRPHVHKGESARNQGAFIGMADKSNQAFVLSVEGIKACRTVRGAAPNTKWNPDFLLAMERTIPEAPYGEQDPPDELPSNMEYCIPRRAGGDIPRVLAPPAVGAGIPQVQLDEGVEVSDEEDTRRRLTGKQSSD